MYDSKNIVGVKLTQRLRQVVILLIVDQLNPAKPITWQFAVHTANCKLIMGPSPTVGIHSPLHNSCSSKDIDLHVYDNKLKWDHHARSPSLR
jgi:hypothetical protein